MSAFIVSDETIHRCVSAFVVTASQPHLGTPNEVGEKLRTMNREAYFQRYYELVDPDSAYAWDDRDFTDGEMWKALQCFLYQCAEGDVDKSDLYRQTELVAGMIERGLTGDPTPSEKRRDRAWAMTDKLPWDF